MNNTLKDFKKHLKKYEGIDDTFAELYIRSYKKLAANCLKSTNINILTLDTPTEFELTIRAYKHIKPLEIKHGKFKKIIRLYEQYLLFKRVTEWL